MIASGAALPLMNIVFGKFINIFNDFVSGDLSAEAYKREIGKFSYVPILQKINLLFTYDTAVSTLYTYLLRSSSSYTYGLFCSLLLPSGR